MGLIADLAVIVFILFSLYRGYKKGFAITLVNSFSYILSLILTACFYKSATAYIAKSKVGLALSEKVGIILSNSLAEKTDTLISELPLPNILKVGIADGDFFQETVNVLSNNITNAILTIITVILLFIVIRFLLKIMKGPIKAIASLPVIRFFDKTLGAAVGIVSAAFWIYVVMALIGMFSFVSVINNVAEFILASDFAKTFYDNNLLIFMIS